MLQSVFNCGITQRSIGACALQCNIAGMMDALNTLRDWVRAFEAKGAAGLMPAQRKDRGEKRVLVTRV